jgi:hypothetical protein
MKLIVVKVTLSTEKSMPLTLNPEILVWNNINLILELKI